MFELVKIDEIHKTCYLNLKLYKLVDDDFLKGIISTILYSIFANNNIYKVNIITDIIINAEVFIEYGFEIEGILKENEFINNKYIDQVIYGITKKKHNVSLRKVGINIKGRDIIIRNIKTSDSEELAKYYIRNKKHLEKFEPDREESFYTNENQKKKATIEYLNYIKEKTIETGIFIDGKLIGIMKVYNIINGSINSGMIGYSIDEKYQGKGYMKEALKLFLDYLFKTEGFHRIEASVMRNNNRSINLLKSCNFVLLGINRKYVCKNDVYFDYETYYLIKEDFC
ncbi:GNAT family N-acetyltransferase [Clostridium sp. BJN0001]|uniref:GNAT family N-acetyltransferase n=1 Tax=Clostridium sp. BJN0001 TaxID=2930219 RepID=UPI001FD04742|nr:GNAT family N-acetyltransferase [Clostridium sp. BJN0001]